VKINGSTRMRRKLKENLKDYPAMKDFAVLEVLYDNILVIHCEDQDRFDYSFNTVAYLRF
jgi:hypothetical protein